MIRRSMVAALLPGLVLAACVSTNAAIMNNRLIRPAITPDSVVLYRQPARCRGPTTRWQSSTPRATWT